MLGQLAIPLVLLVSSVLLPPLRRPRSPLKILLMLLNLCDLSPEPIYSHIYGQIRTSILSGAPAESEPLSADSTQARDHRVSAQSAAGSFSEPTTEEPNETTAESGQTSPLTRERRGELARQWLFGSLHDQELSLEEREAARDTRSRLLARARMGSDRYAVGALPRSAPASDLHAVDVAGDRIPLGGRDDPVHRESRVALGLDRRTRSPAP